MRMKTQNRQKIQNCKKTKDYFSKSIGKEMQTCPNSY